MKIKTIVICMLAGIFISTLSSCNKEDLDANDYALNMAHLSSKWKVQEANKNSTGLESDNGEDVTYDWTNWNIEFWDNNAYKIIEYSPDSTSVIIESGSWQIDLEGQMLLRGTSSLIDFGTGIIIDEGATERYWVNKKNEANQLWVWIENSYYGSTGVFLKMIP